MPQRTYGIACGDFTKLGRLVPSNSVSLLLTDPPYNKDSLYLYAEVSALASRVLAHHGVCLVYCGKMYLKDVLWCMSCHLTYQWVLRADFTGDLRGIKKVGLLDGWRPIVMYARCNYRPKRSGTWNTWPVDVVQGPAEKDQDPWQQSQAEAEQLIEAFTQPGDMVLDPMCCTGTVLAAAKRLGRKFLGFEMDADRVAIARQRLAEVR
jgi:hypothetical protein